MAWKKTRDSSEIKVWENDKKGLLLSMEYFPVESIWWVTLENDEKIIIQDPITKEKDASLRCKWLMKRERYR